MSGARFGLRIAASCLVAVLATATFGLAAGMTAPAAGATTEAVSHWNIFGGCSSGGSCGRLVVTAKYRFLVGASNPKPFTITANEVCGAHFNDLNADFSSLGYKGRFVQTNIGVNCGTNNGTGIHGNAVWELGAFVSATNTYYYSSQASSGDVRAFRCVEANLFGYQRIGCVTHLDPGRGTITQNQSNEALFILTSGTGSIPIGMGGDFNLTTVPGWPVNWWEIDSAVQRWTWNTRSSTKQKIYYFWGDKTNHSGRGNPSTYCDAAQWVSDHCLLAGDFYV